jgi:hypothetical protein
VEHRVYETHWMALFSSSYEYVIPSITSIRGIVNELCSRNANDSLKSRDPVRSASKSCIDGLVQNGPWDGKREQFQPLLLVTSLFVMLISCVEESEEKS